MLITRKIQLLSFVRITFILKQSNWLALYVKLSLCSAIIEHTNQVIYLEDNDVASVSQGMLTIRRMCFNSADRAQSAVREITTLKMQIQQIMKGNLPMCLVCSITTCVLVSVSTLKYLRGSWHKYHHATLHCVARWRSGRVLDLHSVGRGFESQPPHCRVQPWKREMSTPYASVTKQYNLVPANEQWCLAAGKVTVGLASHWPRVTDINGSPPTGSRPGRGRWAPPMLSCGAWLTTFTLHYVDRVGFTGAGQRI